MLHTGLLPFVGVCLLLVSCQVGVNPPSYVLPKPSVAVPSLVDAPDSRGALVKPSLLPLRPSPGFDVPSSEPSLVPVPPAGNGGGGGPPAVPVGSGSRGGSGGGSVTSNFYISDVVLTASGESVMGANAPAKIHADYTSDAPVSLLLKGKFKGLSALPLSAKQFSYEAGLRYQSYEGDEPVLRVLLDETLILEVVSFSESHLEVLLPQRDVSELYLQGRHNLTVHAESQKTQTTFLVGEPQNPIPTFPQIISAEPIAISGQAGLLMKGRFFLLNPSWQSVEMDGKRVVIQRVDTLSDGQSLLWITLPEALLPGAYLIRYTSPMGVTQFTLEVP